MPNRKLYRIIFHNQDKIYEMYAKSVHHGSMFGFVEVEEIVFGEKSSVVVDPSEENLKSEFSHVTRTFIPMHSVIRIDEVKKQGTAKISKAPPSESNVMHFPVYTKSIDTDK